MALPMANGGPGSPHLELHADAHLLATYMQASCSRSPTAQAAAAFLAIVHYRGDERQWLTLGARLVHVQLTVLLDPLTNLEIHTGVSLNTLTTHTHLLLSVDGALRGHDTGSGIVLATPFAPPTPCPTNIWSLKNTVQTGAFIGHTVRCA